jgi:hypothetical protein
MELPSTFVSELLTSHQMRDALEALQRVLRELVGDVPLVARYGWGCELHPDLRGAPMRVGTAGVEQFIRDSLRQQIIVPGESDVHFELPEGRLQIVFCHEGHVHVGGSDQQLAERFVSARPFAELFLSQRV